ncbi:MAG: hypothetical protein NT041_00475 [Candidatus Vogelbacteria bacterium]|nr:hypothetical protein [Candidatus Vogelbacteria bacterium]
MKKSTLKTLSGIVAVLVLLGVFAFLVGQISRPVRMPPPPGRHQPWNAAETARIQPWLTFDYINFVFRLPPNYLAGKLPVPDSRYPNISIEKYADRHNLDQKQFLTDLKAAIQDYLTQASSTPA